MTATRLPTGFASLDQPASWPAPRSRPRPELLELQLDTLPGVGPRGGRRRGGSAARASDPGGEGRAPADSAPVSPASEEITPKRLRGLVGAALAHAGDYGDPLPAEFKARENLPLRADALHA